MMILDVWEFVAALLCTLMVGAVIGMLLLRMLARSLLQ